MRGLLGVGVAVVSGEQKIAATADSSGGTGGTSTTPKSSGGGTGDVGCPPGVTVKSSGNADADGDELGTEPDDQDGCV